jgi:hypothetical protein
LIVRAPGGGIGRVSRLGIRSSWAVYQDALPSRLGCILTAERRPKGKGWGARGRSTSSLRRPAGSAVQTIAPRGGDRHVLQGLAVASSPQNAPSNNRSAQRGIAEMYTLWNRTGFPLGTDGLRSSSGAWARASSDGGRVSDLSGLATLRISWVPRDGPPGGSCHAGKETVIFDRRAKAKLWDEIVDNAVAVRRSRLAGWYEGS